MPDIDFEKYRLRTFVQRLIEMGEVEVRDEQAPLTRLSQIIEGTDKAILFKQAGPERLEMIAKVAGGRKRLAAAFDTSEDKLYDLYFARKANPQQVVEVPSDEAPVHAIRLTGGDVNLTRLPFHPQHEFDGSCYISSAIDYTIDPQTGRTNTGCRRLSLRNRTQTGTNVTAPSDLKRIYTAAVARGEKLPITFTVGSHTLDFLAATASTARGRSATARRFPSPVAPPRQAGRRHAFRPSSRRSKRGPYSTPHWSRRWAAKMGARSLARSTTCGKRASSGVTETAAITWRAPRLA